MTSDIAQTPANSETGPQPFRRLRNMKIWVKLTLALGILAVCTVLVVLISVLSSAAASQSMSRTDEVRLPATLALQRTQADSQRMLTAVQAYLALGDPQYRSAYAASEDATAGDLKALSSLSGSFSDVDKQLLQELNTTFEQWTKLPNQLFDLRDNQAAREPAYKTLTEEGLPLATAVLNDTEKLIDQQSTPEANAGKPALLGDIARFQGTFAAIAADLSGYVMTHDSSFRDEYQGDLAAENQAWYALQGQRSSLSPAQQETFDDMAAKREAFLKLPDQIFQIMESDQWRQDHYLYTTQAAPLADQMARLLDELTTDQQKVLESDLSAGRGQLDKARLVVLAAGLLAVLLGLAAVFFVRHRIAGPIERLTNVADQVRTGDLTAQAKVESGDEIGTLAETFNRMIRQLRRTLVQTRRQKKRADDLLNVVIPLGVQLRAEKQLDKLLENVVIQAKTFCNANSGVLYLRTSASQLQPIVLRDDLAQLALGGTTGEPIPYDPIPLDDPMHSLAVRACWFGKTTNVPDAIKTGATDYVSPAFADDPYANNTSFLALPLKSIEGQVMGVLQLTGAQDPDTEQIVPFDSHLQQMMESFSSLAAAALEAYLREQGLQEQIQQLRIEIDEVKRQKQVNEIVESDFFQNLQSKARSLRARSQPQPKPLESGDGPT